jgi:hypothetical protein
MKMRFIGSLLGNILGMRAPSRAVIGQVAARESARVPRLYIIWIGRRLAESKEIVDLRKSGMEKFAWVFILFRCTLGKEVYKERFNATSTLPLCGDPLVRRRSFSRETAGFQSSGNGRRSSIGVRSKERVNGTRMTRITQIIADKIQKGQRQSASSASSAFYQRVH